MDDDNDEVIGSIHKRLDDIDDRLKNIKKGGEIEKAISEMLEYTTTLEKSIDSNTKKVVEIMEESDLNKKDFDRVTATMVSISSSMKKYKSKVKENVIKIQELRDEFHVLSNHFSDYQMDTDTRIASLKSEMEYAITTLIS